MLAPLLFRSPAARAEKGEAGEEAVAPHELHRLASLMLTPNTASFSLNFNADREDVTNVKEIWHLCWNCTFVTELAR